MRKSFLIQKSSQKRSLTIRSKKLASSSLFNEKQKQKQRQKQKQKYRYYIGPGNNANLIRRIMSTRRQWQQIIDPKYLFINFKWQQSNKTYKYENCVDNKIFKQSLNHLQFHQQLSNKQYLFKNLQQYCEQIKINVFDITPMTFVLNFADTTQFQYNQNNFIRIYQSNLPQQMNKPMRKQNLNFKKRKSLTNNKNIIDVKSKRTHTIYQLNHLFKQPQNSKYLWILKPTFQNRGDGIHVFNNLEQLQNLINHYLHGQTTNNSINNSGIQNNKTISKDLQTQISPSIKRKNFRIRDYTQQHSKIVTSFIIQKYLQRPLLFQGRKFDIRVWVLFTYDLKVYLFKQGYMRTSSYKYSTNEQQLQNLNIHLTNNAVQKHNKQYGRFQDGNQLSFKVLKNLIQRHGYNYNEIINKMKWIIKLTALSVKKKINKNQRYNCMEIFGYDFMLDENCNPYLIEVNTNPCIEESSQLLETLLPRMLDDAFSLTIDRVFDTDKKGYNYTIQNQYNTDNLWQIIVDLKKGNTGSHQVVVNPIE